MEKWFVQSKKADFEQWGKELGIDIVTARILRNRDIMTIDEARSFLYSDIKNIHSPWLLKDMDKATKIILEAIEAGKKIRIIGDYDVDGVTSSFILNKGFELLGGEVSVAIPHRIHDGYGLSDDLVKRASEDGIGLIVTCDNGISASSQIDLANELGIDVVVTDHHEVPFDIDGDEHIQKLPKALAVVNPKRDDCTYPFKGICGAMVAYKLVLALFEKMPVETINQSVLEELLIFAAIGTVCDVMELKDENRIVVKEGLNRISNTTNAGLRALIEVNKLELSKISAYHFGFVIGPCINATGRLDTAKRALELLNSKSKAEAVTIATELKGLNDSRKNLTNKGIEEADKYIEVHDLKNKSVWVIFLPDVHESIAGIIAGRVKEKYNHPVYVITRAEGMLKGSGRSIEGYHMQENLVMIDSLLEKYGGHAMAAGLSLKEENLAEFEKAVNENAKLNAEDFVAKISIDVPMPLEYASIKLARELDKLEPFGTGNKQPLFAQKDLIFVSITPFGSNKQYSRFSVKNENGKIFELTSFEEPQSFYNFLDEKYGSGSADKFKEKKAEYKVSVTYQISINNFRGEKLQYTMKNYC